MQAKDIDLTKNIFEQGTRLALTFGSPKGNLTIEDLWNLPLTAQPGRANLDDIAKGLFTCIQAAAQQPVSFVKPETTAGTSAKKRDELAFAIVKHIIDVKVAERDVEAQTAERAAKKQQLLEVLARRENAELEGKSPEEIRAMIAAL